MCYTVALTSTTPRLYMSAAKVHGSLFPSRSSGAEYLQEHHSSVTTLACGNLSGKQTVMIGHWGSSVQLHSITGLVLDHPNLQKGRLCVPLRGSCCARHS